MEYLTNCIRNDIVSFQTYSAKLFNTEKIRLINDSDSDSDSDYFQNIYKILNSEPADLSGCIEQFLGPDILANPILKNSKLSPAESAKLELPLSLSELDAAVKQANTRSAPGLDGLNTAFKTKFWGILRIPLLRYANCCFKKGELTPTFKTASIWLIPKKGSHQNIKNWRPISLLSNLYKIISRALNTRLKSTTDTITSRAQKGFTSSRYLQEVLINVIEFIGHCKSNNLPGVVLSIDYSKAFDTLSIKFLTEC